MKKKGFKKGKHITEVIFGKVKKLLEVGLTNAQAGEILGYSYNVIHRISKTKDFAEYKAYNKEYCAKVMAKVHGPTEKDIIPLKPQSDDIKTPLWDTLKEILEEMRILNKLVAQTGKSKKFRLF